MQSFLPVKQSPDFALLTAHFGKIQKWAFEYRYLDLITISKRKLTTL
jgi:hypothetical protein